MNEDEQPDIELQRLYDEQAKVNREFREALDKLLSLAEDFSEGSQERWGAALRNANTLRDRLWSLHLRMGEV